MIVLIYDDLPPSTHETIREASALHSTTVQYSTTVPRYSTVQQYDSVLYQNY